MKEHHTNTENEERLSTILNSVSDAVIATDEQGLITFMNPVAEILTGWEMEEGSGKHVTDILNIYVGNAGNLIKDTSLICLLYTSPSPRDRTRSRMPSSA